MPPKEIMSMMGSRERGGSYHRRPSRGRPAHELNALGVGGNVHAGGHVHSRSQVISRITMSGSMPRVCGGHAAPPAGPVLDPDLGSLGLSLSSSVSSSVPTGSTASDEATAYPARLIRSVSNADINEFLEKLAVDALSRSFPSRRTDMWNKSVPPVSYQWPSSSSSSGPAYTREAYATGCHASLKSDGSALPVSCQQQDPTLLPQIQHLPEAHANGGEDREAAHKLEAHATGCSATPSSQSASPGLYQRPGSILSWPRFSPELSAIFLEFGLCRQGGTKGESIHRREAHATDCRAFLKSDESALPVSYPQPGTILVAGAAHRREAHATGCCVAPSSWSVGDGESEPLDSSLAESLHSSVKTGGKDYDGIVARSARDCMPGVVLSVVTPLGSDESGLPESYQQPRSPSAPGSAYKREAHATGSADREAPRGRKAYATSEADMGTSTGAGDDGLLLPHLEPDVEMSACAGGSGHSSSCQTPGLSSLHLSSTASTSARDESCTSRSSSESVLSPEIYAIGEADGTRANHELASQALASEQLRLQASCAKEEAEKELTKHSPGMAQHTDIWCGALSGDGSTHRQWCEAL